MNVSANPLPAKPADLALTPRMRSVLDRLERAGHPRLDTLSPREARAAYEIGASVLDVPKAALARVEDIHVPARDGHALRLRVYAPTTEPGLPLLLYFHGGGFVIGSIGTHDVLCRELSRLSGAMVASLDYRLAPGHKFPTAVHDAEDALRWLCGNAASIGADPARIAVGGDSAGGTLGAACAILARDAKLPIALQLLFYPGVAAHQDTLSHYRFGSGLVLEAPTINWFFDQYLRGPADRRDWRFAPLTAPDVEGVAPAWIGLAEFDPLVDEGLLYADKLRAARVAVDLEIYRGVAHDFIKMGRAIPEARQAHREAACALRRAFGTL